MLKKEFWIYFFKTYKSAKWVLLKYLILAVYLTISSILANTMNINDLTYFNAILSIAYFCDIIAFGISNGVSVYINQNIKDEKIVTRYIKVGLYLNFFCSIIFVIILASCYYPVLHGLLALPTTIDYKFYFVMLIYMFFSTNSTFICNILKELKIFIAEMLDAVIKSCLIIIGFLITYFCFNMSLDLIPLIYIFTTITTLTFVIIYFKNNKYFKVNLFKFTKFKISKEEFIIIWRMFVTQFIWQIGYIMLSFFILRVSEIFFNQYSYFENVLDLFNGLLFSFIVVTSIDICRQLGENKFKEAYKTGTYSLYATIVIWFIYFILSLSFSIPIINGMSKDIQSGAFISLLLYVVMHLFRFLSWNLSSYILCWGGKVRLLMWQEVIAMLYFVGIYFIAQFLPVNIYLTYAFIMFPPIVLTILDFIIFKRKNWMKNINNNIKVVIFDFDDTLYSGVDWTPWNEFCVKALNYFFKNENFNDIKDLSDEYIVKKLIENKKNVNVWLDYREHNECPVDLSNCKVTSNSTLSKFAEKYKIYIVSNSTLKEINETSKQLNIDLSLFSGIYINKFENGQTSKKFIYQEIIQKENIKPEELFVIGNSEKNDISPAIEIGAKGKVIESADFSIEDFSL